jgi:hypothetical protein
MEDVLQKFQQRASVVASVVTDDVFKENIERDDDDADDDDDDEKAKELL